MKVWGTSPGKQHELNKLLSEWYSIIKISFSPLSCKVLATRGRVPNSSSCRKCGKTSEVHFTPELEGP
jgi:hypothetical protein